MRPALPANLPSPAASSRYRIEPANDSLTIPGRRGFAGGDGAGDVHHVPQNRRPLLKPVTRSLIVSRCRRSPPYIPRSHGYAPRVFDVASFLEPRSVCCPPGDSRATRDRRAAAASLDGSGCCRQRLAGLRQRCVHGRTRGREPAALRRGPRTLVTRVQISTDRFAATRSWPWRPTWIASSLREVERP
jgi:hypothetical protein